jgi:hypothetical protein
MKPERLVAGVSDDVKGVAAQYSAHLPDELDSSSPTRMPIVIYRLLERLLARQPADDVSRNSEYHPHRFTWLGWLTAKSSVSKNET